MNKKGNFSVMNAGLLTFISFVLITLMVLVTLSILKSGTVVCGDDPNGLPLRSVNGVCQTCALSSYVFNTTGNFCCNVSTSSCTGANATAIQEYSSYLYNGTKQLSAAALLPPQFASIIVIVLIIVGILSLLAVIGYNVYQKIK